MNVKLNSLYRSYRHIVLISNDPSALGLFCELSNARKCHIKHPQHEKYLANNLVGNEAIDLLVIDVDSVGLNDASYLYFWRFVFFPVYRWYLWLRTCHPLRGSVTYPAVYLISCLVQVPLVFCRLHRKGACHVNQGTNDSSGG